jgi:positive regulator of sigma E activity
MRRKYIFPFLIAVVTLILSEYFFLQEAFGRSNVAILVLTGAGVTFGIAFIVSLIRKYN